jgi:hypothetical protein
MARRLIHDRDPVQEPALNGDVGAPDLIGSDHGLALPGAHLVRMHLLATSYSLGRPVASKRLKRNLGLEFRR